MVVDKPNEQGDQIALVKHYVSFLNFCPVQECHVRLTYQTPVNTHNKSATKHQPIILFSQNKSAPATNH
jgi:hypothetical protein